MKNDLYIQSYCHIKNNSVALKGNVLFEHASEDFSVFIKNAYKTLNTKYPKFFKMDNLSKLAFMAADILLKDSSENLETEPNIALVFSNNASSLDTDRKHQASIEDAENFYPSPAVFVYTLPNICLGEISIKHKLFSENSFFIFDHFNPKHLHSYANNLMDHKKAEKVLCGWVNYDTDNYEAFLYLVANEGAIPHSTKEITRLYEIL